MADSTKEPRLQRPDDFVRYYANNISVESSVWDLRILFGQLDQAAGLISQDASLTMPWTVAKLLTFYLRTQILAHELQNGKIVLPDAILPPEFNPPAEEFANNPLYAQTHEAINKLRADFIKDAKS